MKHEKTGREQLLAIALGLALLTMLAYSRAPYLSFLDSYDDALYVTDNEHVQRGLTWDGVAWAFTTGHAANWHPLTWLSHMLDVTLFGMNPSMHHVVNVFIHALNVLLLFFLIHRWTVRAGPSAIVTALWAVHPLHVESVAWIAERKDVLSGLFWLLALHAYTRYVRQPRGRAQAYAATCFFTACGLMAKPMVVTLPFVMLLLDFWPLRRLRWFGNVPPEAVASTVPRIVIEKLPLFALSVVSGIVTVLAQERYGAVQHMSDLPLPYRLANAAMAYMQYLGKAFAPFELAAIYPHPGASIDLGAAAVAGLFLLLTTVVFLTLARHIPYLIVGWLWFLGTLVPVIGIVQVGSQSMADRYTYLPHIGLYIVVVWLASDAFRPRKQWAVALAVLTVVTFTAITYRQVDRWRDGVTLFEYAVAVTGPNPLARINLGNALMDQGDVAAALAHFDAAAETDTDLGMAYYNQGVALRRLGRDGEARQAFEKALTIDPADGSSYNNLGMIALSAERNEEAETYFRAAIEHDPVLWEAYINLGSLLARRGAVGEAESLYRQVIEKAPRQADALMNLANLCARTGRGDEARMLFEAAIVADPLNHLAHYNLALLLTQSGDNAGAQEHLDEANRLRSGHN